MHFYSKTSLLNARKWHLLSVMVLLLRWLLLILLFYCAHQHKDSDYSHDSLGIGKYEYSIFLWASNENLTLICKNKTTEKV